MTALRIARAVRGSVSVFCRDVGRGLLEVCHNTLATVGLVVVLALVFAAGHGHVRDKAEDVVLAWLQERHIARAEANGDHLLAVSEASAVHRATAVDLEGLSREQAKVAQWIARRYRVAPEPIGRLVQEAWSMGQRAGLDPTLILAVMAVESSFNPFAQSPVGAQGLMQVLTRVHDDKYSRFGGTHAAFDPVTNLRVGVQVLKDCIARAGSIEEGLRYYVGAANLPHDGGYAEKVLGEHANLRRVAAGEFVPVHAQTRTVKVPAPPAAAPAEQEAEAAPSRPAPSAPGVALS